MCLLCLSILVYVCLCITSCVGQGVIVYTHMCVCAYYSIGSLSAYTIISRLKCLRHFGFFFRFGRSAIFTSLIVWEILSHGGGGGGEAGGNTHCNIWQTGTVKKFSTSSVTL